MYRPGGMDIRKFLWGIAFVVIALTVVGYFFLRARQSRIAEWSPAKVVIAEPTQPGAALAYIAFTKGHFRSKGIDATLQHHTSGKAALEAVLEGRADLAVVAETPIMFAVMKGEKICPVATIFTSDKNMAIIARKDRGISLPSELKGKRIGVSPGTNGEFFMDTLLVLHGIPKQEINAVNLKPEEMVDSLVKGEVDAVSTWHPHLIRLQKKLGDRGITFYGSEIYMWTFNVAATQAFVRKNPEIVKKVLQSLVEAEKFIREKPDESRTIVADFIKMDKALLDELWDIYHFRVTLDQSLLLTLENQTRWAIKNRLTSTTNVPNYLDFIYADGMRAVKPDAITIIR